MDLNKFLMLMRTEVRQSGQLVHTQRKQLRARERERRFREVMLKERHRREARAMREHKEMQGLDPLGNFEEMQRQHKLALIREDDE